VATSLPSSLPSGSYSTLDGDSVALGSYQGQVLVVNFWASWCKGCKLELPRLEELSAEYGPKGVVFLTVNEDEEANDRDKYLAKRPLGLPILLDPKGTLAKEMGGDGSLPLTVIIDRQSKIVSVENGFSSKWREEMTATLEKLLK
jgi:thiol-disulfide isomerase/thioredoxin